MRIAVHCHQCFEEGRRRDAGKVPPYIPSYPPSQYPQIELDHWPFYEYTCPNGHTHRITLSNELYELLFQQAIYCIQDGYYRESIGTFHAALERFMEFATEVLSLKVSPDVDFGAIWKTIGDQSERQLGAYYITYQHALCKEPQKIDEKRVKLRNDVVHKGLLVSRNEAINHGQYVMDYIKDALSEIRIGLGEDFDLMCALRHMRICRPDIDKAFKNLIQVETESDVGHEGIGSVFYSCFIHDESLQTIYDCLVVPSGYGLMK